MAAVVGIHVYTGSNAGNESGVVTGIDLISADNATNSTTNRQSYPITAGTKSYEKWLKAKVESGIMNYVTNFNVWGDGAITGSTVLNLGKTASGATPVNTTSSVATNAFTAYTTSAKFAWHATNMTANGSTTDYLVFQLVVNADAAAGDWGPETISYSYDEA